MDLKKVVDIVIVGGGIAGLYMGALLEKLNKFSYLILERDESFGERAEGFSLTMQGRALELLREIGVGEEFLANSVQSERSLYFNSQGELLVEKSLVNRLNRPIPRQRLRSLFLSQIPTDNIRWNCTPSFSHQKQRFLISLDSSLKTIECTTLIAADGVHSAVRRHFLPNVHLNRFDNLVNIYALINVDQTNNDDLLKSSVTFQVVDGTSRLFSKPFDRERRMIEFTSTLPFLSDNLVETMKQLTKRWRLPCLELLFENIIDESVSLHALYDYDPSSVDVPEVGLVFIGDSLHPTAPFKGLGANCALEDAFVVYSLLQKFGLNSAEFNANYYEDMNRRASRMVLESRAAVNFFHPNPPRLLTNDEIKTFKTLKIQT